MISGSHPGTQRDWQLQKKISRVKSTEKRGLTTPTDRKLQSASNLDKLLQPASKNIAET
jgi:hypothetical protein